MQFSPKKQELYLSLLRNHLHKSILRDGITPKDLYKIKKLEIFSILNKKHIETSIDLSLFCAINLYSIQALLLAKNKFIEISVDGSGIFYSNKKLLCALICEIAILANENGRISVKITKKGIKIYYTGLAPNKILKKLIFKLSGITFSVKKNNLYLIFIPLKPSFKKSEKITGAVSLLTDPLSDIKIFTADLI